jgi:hypothetical protein
MTAVDGKGETPADVSAEFLIESPSEVAIRRYLEFVANPDSARDDAAIEQLESQLAVTSHMLGRLRLLSDIERAKQVDGAPLLDEFVKHARMWAASNRITVDAFKAMGVSQVVLAQAGFDLGHGSIHDRSAKTAAGSTRGPRRAPQGPSVSSSVVKDWMLGQPGSFTIAQAMAGAGASMMTVKKAANELVAAQRLNSLGQLAVPGVRGRAPEHFSVER